MVGAVAVAHLAAPENGIFRFTLAGESRPRTRDAGLGQRRWSGSFENSKGERLDSKTLSRSAPTHSGCRLGRRALGALLIGDLRRLITRGRGANRRAGDHGAAERFTGRTAVHLSTGNPAGGIGLGDMEEDSLTDATARICKMLSRTRIWKPLTGV